MHISNRFVFILNAICAISISGHFLIFSCFVSEAIVWLAVCVVLVTTIHYLTMPRRKVVLLLTSVAIFLIHCFLVH